MRCLQLIAALAVLAAAISATGVNALQFNLTQSEWIELTVPGCPCLVSFELQADAADVRLRAVASGAANLSWSGEGLLQARADAAVDGDELRLAFGADAAGAGVSLSARVTGRSAPLAEVEAAHAPASAGRWLAPAPRIRLMRRLFGGGATARPSPSPEGAEEHGAGGAWEAAERAAGAGRLAEAASLYEAAGRLAGAHPAALPAGRPRRTTPPPSSGASRGRRRRGGGGRAAPPRAAGGPVPRRGGQGARRGAGGDPGPGRRGRRGGTEEALEVAARQAAWAAAAPRADHFLDLCRAAAQARPALPAPAPSPSSLTRRGRRGGRRRWRRRGAATSTGDAAAAARHFSRLREVAREPSTRAVAASGRLLALSRALVWDSWDEAVAEALEGVAWLLAQPEAAAASAPITPWWAMSLPLPAAAKRAALVRSARFLLRQVAAAGHAAPFPAPSALLPPAAPSGPPRLRIAYYSSYLGETSMGWSWRQVFGLQDRNRVEIYVYNRWEGLGLGDSPVLREVAAAAAKQYDVRGWSARRIAEQINTDGAHVLVHLDFWTAGDLPEISALRPAPVQLHSTIGSTGAPFFDYLFGDRVSTAPEAALGELSEKALVLPPPLSIAMNSLRSILSSEALQQTSREEEGLPPGARVLAVHHRTVKLYPELMDVWGNALRRSPSSVLWMLEELQLDVAPAAGAQLAARGLPASRLLFAPRRPDVVAQARRAALADLYLDTPLYNGVTTLLDYLFGGVPAVTLRGDSISSRVASAMVHSASGAPAASLKAYEDLAALGPGALPRGRGPAAPLFETAAWAAGLDAALAMAADLAAAGEAPAHLILAAAAPSD
eukprot:tig00000663_g3007.t1